MPATLELRCENDDCELDMFELHYTYDMSDDAGVDDFTCPYCLEKEDLTRIEIEVDQ